MKKLKIAFLLVLMSMTGAQAVEATSADLASINNASEQVERMTNYGSFTNVRGPEEIVSVLNSLFNYYVVLQNGFYAHLNSANEKYNEIQELNKKLYNVEVSFEQISERMNWISNQVYAIDSRLYTQSSLAKRSSLVSEYLMLKGNISQIISSNFWIKNRISYLQVLTSNQNMVLASADALMNKINLYAGRAKSIVNQYKSRIASQYAPTTMLSVQANKDPGTNFSKVESAPALSNNVQQSNYSVISKNLEIIDNNVKEMSKTKEDLRKKTEEGTSTLNDLSGRFSQMEKTMNDYNSL